MTTALDHLRELLEASGQELAAFLPRLLLAALLLPLGWLLARLVRRLVVRGLRFVRADVAAERTGLEDFLVQGGVRSTSVTLVGSFAYWGINLAVILAALTLLGIETAGQVVHRLVQQLPYLATVVVVLILATLLGQFVGALTKAYLASLGVAGVRAIAVIARWAVVVFVIAASLEQLAIGGQVLVSAFQIAFGALCLALAIAFGLGGRAWAARVLDSFFKE